MYENLRIFEQQQKALNAALSRLRAVERAVFRASEIPALELSSAMDVYSRANRQSAALLERAEMPYKALAAHMALIRSVMEATRFTVPTIRLDQLGALIGGRERSILARLTNELLADHTSFIGSLTRPAKRKNPIPLTVSKLATDDVFVHVSAVRSVTPHQAFKASEEKHTAVLRQSILSETDAFLEETLPKLKPAFLQQYRGAKAHIYRQEPDWWTQGGASMRKLLKGVLHTVAPDGEVLPWAEQQECSLDTHGRPTRAAKIHWLCRDTSNDHYRKLVVTELESTLALIALLDTSQHVDEFPEFEGKYEWIVLRSEVAIRHLLELWKARDGKQDVE